MVTGSPRGDARWNACDYGVVPGNSTSLGYYNRLALNELMAEVSDTGGGSILFPAAPYRFLRDENTAETFVLQGRSNIRFVGEGPGSRLLWDGDLPNAAGHFFKIERGCKDITFESLYMSAGVGAKTDSAEQHHLVLITANPNNTTPFRANENIQFLKCHFGYTRGDAINIAGGIAQTICHAAFAGTVAAGAVPGPYTQPVEPTRIAVRFNAGWDGGNITVNGTDIQGLPITELVTGVADSTPSTFQEFATIVDVAKSATGVNSATCSIGFSYESRRVWIDKSIFNGFDVSGGAPQTNGFRSAVACQRFAVDVFVTYNFMTGCGDQLIDFEATGNGGVGPWDITGNRLICATPQQGHDPPKTAIAFWGNAEAASERNTRSKIDRNYIVGVIGGGKTERVDITNNIIVPVAVAASGGGITLSGTNNDVLIAHNRIIGNPIAVNDPISVDVNNGVGSDGVTIYDNTIEWYGTRGIFVEGAKRVEIASNRFYSKKATTNVGRAIRVAANDPNDIAWSDVNIHDNVVFGNAGGGSLENGIDVTSNNQTNGRLQIKDNTGEGCATRGVQVPTGTYSSYPRVFGNEFTGATAQLSLGTGVVVIVAGNAGSWKTLQGTLSDPNQNAALDAETLGTQYVSAGGATIYRKSVAGAGGWVAI